MKTAEWTYDSKPTSGVTVLVLLEDDTITRCSVDDKGMWNSWVTIVAWRPIEEERK